MSEQKRDYYEVLGLSKDATEDAITEAFFRLAEPCNPMASQDPDAIQHFHELCEAYQVLISATWRKAYDEGGFDALATSGFVYDDMWQRFMNDEASHQELTVPNSKYKADTRAIDGKDVKINLSISAEEALNGCTKEISYKTKICCPHCHSVDTTSPNGRMICPECSGTGLYKHKSRYLDLTVTCDTCKGTGVLIFEPCPQCHGAGVVDHERTYQFTVPAGVSDGTVITVKYAGDAGVNYGGNGDLLVTIKVKPEVKFTKDGSDLYCLLPISFAMSALGGKVPLKTPYGKVSVKIEPGTQSGTMLRLSDLGDHEHGDLYCEVQVQTPTQLTQEQRDLIEKLDECLSKGYLDEECEEPSKDRGFSLSIDRSEDD